MSYLSVGTEKRDFSIQGSEEFVDSLFDLVVKEIISSGVESHTEPVLEESPEEVFESVSAVENDCDTSKEEEAISVVSVGSDENSVQNTEKEPESFNRERKKVHQGNSDLPGMYRGFLYMKCEHCGEVRGFNARNEIDTYTCNSCGKPTFLYDVVPLTAVCECGKRWRYMTNMKEDSFEVNCLTCGYPIPIYFNDKKRKYETLFEGEKRFNQKKKGKGKR